MLHRGSHRSLSGLSGCIAIAAVLVATSFVAAQTDESAAGEASRKLGIGDNAPPLVYSEWVQGEAPGEATTPDALFQLVHPEDRPALLRATAQPGPWELEVRILAHDGTALRVVVAGESQDDRVLGVVRRVDRGSLS